MPHPNPGRTMAEDATAGLLDRLGIKAISATQMEHQIEQQAEQDLSQQQRSLEEQRLAKVRESRLKLEQRLSGRLAPARLAQLMNRLDELRAEEASVLERLAGKLPEITADDRVEITAEHGIEREDVSAFLDFEDDAADDLASAKEIPAERILSKDASASESGSEESEEESVLSDGDDLNDADYEARAGANALLAALSMQVSSLPTVDLGEVDWRIPSELWGRLLPYQREGVKWMVRMQVQEGEPTGGILGDEMGLGKTLQVIAMTAALLASGKLRHPVLIVAPATLLRQWRREFHSWAPHLRCLVLHSPDQIKATLACAKNKGHVLVTSYGYLLAHNRALTSVRWSLAVLDEGHRIRNPEAAVTKAAKTLRASMRLLVSGTPIQNNLIELWSLVDFCRPGWLGQLPLFRAQMALPIAAGSWLNATSLQIHTAYRCALSLRDLLRPLLLRRVKSEVAKELPAKDEQILFCPLTPFQRRLYERLLQSDPIQAVLEGKRNVLAGIDLLRKVCNHPSLLLDSADRLGVPEEVIDDLDPQERVESGKMRVMQAVLAAWQEEGHRVLLFCQTRQMLDLVEESIQARFTHLRLDGSTPIKQRLALVEQFNRDPSCFLMLLTTRVGGLGLNLIGADRVIIYDPDWNPSTDHQARERAWRLGQVRPVTIYRLLSGGTIEEKIYHRQIYKHFLSQRILADPKQIGLVRTSHLHDLFSLDDRSETPEIFAEHEQPEAETKKKANGKDHVLQSLFAASGLQAALPHDRLLGEEDEHGHGKVTLAPLIEREAKRLAEQAVASLKQSRLGNEGSLPKSSATPPPPSAAILAAIRNRSQPTADSSPNPLSPEHQNLLRRLVEQLEGHGGRLTSDRIASLFEREVSSPSEAAVFRQMLRTIATFDPHTRHWTLRHF